MYRGFNLKLKPTLIEIERYRERGLDIYNSDRKIIEKTIENYSFSTNSNTSRLTHLLDHLNILNPLMVIH